MNRYSTSQQASTLAVIMVLAALVVQIDGSSGLGLGLRCNTCVATKQKLGFCRVMHCKSMDDVRKGYAELKKHPSFHGEQPDTTQKTKEFVCQRTVGQTTPGGPPDYIYSFCAPRIPAFPPSEKPYPISKFGAASGVVPGPEMRSSSGKGAAVKGEVYVCNEKTGNGPNCGPRAIVGRAFD